MHPRALTFGAAASVYEHYRLGYPQAVADAVLDYAGRPVGTALEVGAGTGKATRLFAERGIAVTATDPDAAMLRELAEHVPASVTIEHAAFEDLGGLGDQGGRGGPYDLVYAAAAMHWTDSEGRWPRVSTLLVPGGTYANFGGPVDLIDERVASAVQAARRPDLDDDDIGSPDGTPADSQLQWPGTELQRSPLFEDVRQGVIERRVVMSATDYVGHLSTISAYLQLSAATRAAVLGRIRAVLPERVELAADIVFHLARRVGVDR